MGGWLGNGILGSFLMLSALVGISCASYFQISSVHLSNTANPGQPLLPSQAQAQAAWEFNVSFNGTGRSINASIGPEAINYTDAQGRVIHASYPISIYGTLSQENAYYEVNLSSLAPIETMSSYTTLGSVYQGGSFSQNATAAPQCYPAGLYSEWDFFVHVQVNVVGGARNVVVGRVCIYNQTIGWAARLSESPTMNMDANISLDANGQQEVLRLPYNGTPAVSSDGLAVASWEGLSGIALGASPMPNGTQYFALESHSSDQWYLVGNSTYMRWYNQYHKFVQDKIPHFNEQYSPTSVGILSDSCNVVSVTDLTNQSVKDAVDCMNATASLYYSFANIQTAQLVPAARNLSGYQYSVTALDGKPAVAVNLPAGFSQNTRIHFVLSGQFLGFSLPGGAARILIINASPVSIEGTGTLTMLVENYGSSQDLFTVSINGCPGVAIEPGVSYSVGAGQVANITTSFSAPNANLTLNRQCEVQIAGSDGGGNTKMVSLVSETPNQYLHNEFEGIVGTICNSDGIFTQLLCRYTGV